ncbi:hypothetical protein BC826DRAFT_1034435 [Russula brevipes]|nr:hypothetical protein BC826DRAFT_1034435 [Russula brevipes]
MALEKLLPGERRACRMQHEEGCKYMKVGGPVEKRKLLEKATKRASDLNLRSRVRSEDAEEGQMWHNTRQRMW